MAIEHDERGREIPDDTPVAIPLKYTKPSAFNELVRDIVRSERLRLEMEAQGFESFEESDDFDVGDDYDPTSPYEEVFEGDIDLKEPQPKKQDVPIAQASEAQKVEETKGGT